MEACIARGGISHVLSQARASLKNPSRPYTPRSTARPLFHGDDYRPGSRPSSSYIVTEQRELQQKQSADNAGGSASPSASMLPSCSSASGKTKKKKKKTQSSSSSSGSSSPEDPDPSSVTMTASVSQLKLVHAPMISDDEEERTASPTSMHDDDADNSDADSDARDDDNDHLEASLELPSQDQLIQTYEMAERSLEELTTLSDRSKAPEAIERLRSVVSSFLHVSSFFLSSNSQARVHSGSAASDSAKVQELRLHLFQTLSSLVLEQWNQSAETVLALTPCLFELFNGAQIHDNSANESPLNQQIVSLGKLLFMLSKESANDAAYCNVQYVEAALSVISKACGALHNSVTRAKKPHNRSDKLDNSDVLQVDSLTLAFPMKTLIYVAGTLKNTSSAEEKMLRLLATNGAIATLSDTMRWRSSDSLQQKEIAQFLIQTTGVLRNLSVAKSYHKQFIEAQVSSRLCTLIPAFITHVELMGNVSRILSKLTLHELPRAQINQEMASNLRSLVAVVDCSQNKFLSFLDQQQQQKSENKFQDTLLIRMFFVLGNLCAGNDRNRLFIAFKCDGISVLLQALQFYAAQYCKHDPDDDGCTSGDQHAADDGNGSGSDQSGEVLVKLVRLLANLAINADVGASLNSENPQMSVLLETLEQAQRTGDEELMLNIVSCITNLSYYSSSTTSSSSLISPVVSSSFSLQQHQRSSFIEANRIEITSLLAKILLDRNEEAVVEAARAFGNLTRFKDVLCFMSEHKVLDCFVVLLDHSNREIVYTVCGVLMNAALDEFTRQQLLKVRPDGSNSDVRGLLLGIVECAAADDVDMTCIACKVLYNLLLANGGNGDKGFDSEALHGVVQQLVKTMDARDALRSTARHVNQKSSAARKKRGTRHDDNSSSEDDEDGVEHDDDESQSSSWRELRLVLPQLLRGATR